jgi:hypothetical protein
VNTIIIQPVYSSILTTNSSKYSTKDCSIFHHNYYEAVRLTVLTTGYYRFSSNSSIDLNGYIYQGMFDPHFPSRNLIAEKRGEIDFQMSLYLEVKMNYVLVVTTSIGNQTGAFSITGPGPNYISIQHMSKFIY